MPGSRTRPPLPGRMLARLIVGPDAEVLRGDLEETFHRRVAQEGDSARARLAYTADAAGSLARWWLSGAYRRTDRRSKPNPGGLMRGIGSELRQLWRGLVRRPGYASVVVLTLALGIGATTTIYSVVDTLLIRALPYPGSDRLVVIGNTAPGQETVGARDGLQRLERMSLPNLRDLEQRRPGLIRSGALERGSWLLPDQGDGPDMIQVANVTEGFFDLLGIKLVLGRAPVPSDYWTSGSPAWGTLISYRTWQQRFGGTADVVGKFLEGPGSFGRLTVVGVLPRNFSQPAALVGSEVEFFLPLDPADRRYQSRPRRNLRVVARLLPGVTLERAQAELSSAQESLVRDEPAGNRLPDGTPLGVGVNSLRDETVGSAGRPVLIFLGASVLLLVLACSNAANLLLVRGLEREGELAVRRALGAGRARLAGGLVAESLLLALAGGIVGLGLAAAGVALLHRFAPASLPRLAEVAINPRIALAGALLSILVGVSIGMVPALRSGGGGVNLLSSLRSSLHSVTLGGTRLRSALAATQLALALMLGIAASLLFRSFVQLRTERLGFHPDQLTAFSLPLKVERPWEVWDGLLQAVRAIPGVRAAAGASNLPFQTPDWTPRVERAESSGESSNSGIPGYAVTPDFFATAGIPLLRGRGFDGTDQPDSRPVAIINQSLARGLFSGRDPLGARVRILEENGPGRVLDIVGVVGDVVQGRVEDGIAPAIYVPHTQQWAGVHVLVQSARDPASLGGDLRRAVAQTGYSQMPLRDLSTMESRIAVTQANPRFQLLLIGAFAAAALLLSSVGLYGTLAFTVRSRVKELGIRMAMGADQGMIYRLVMRHGLLVLGIGLVVGLTGALGVTRLLQGFLYRVSPADPLAILIAVGVTAVVVVLAALRPARRAARIDPMESIRAEG
jgi:putative ABC transport system permease protein